MKSWLDPPSPRIAPTFSLFLSENICNNKKLDKYATS